MRIFSRHFLESACKRERYFQDGFPFLLPLPSLSHCPTFFVDLTHGFPSKCLNAPGRASSRLGPDFRRSVPESSGGSLPFYTFFFPYSVTGPPPHLFTQETYVAFLFFLSLSEPTPFFDEVQPLLKNDLPTPCFSRPFFSTSPFGGSRGSSRSLTSFFFICHGTPSFPPRKANVFSPKIVTEEDPLDLPGFTATPFAMRSGHSF